MIAAKHTVLSLKVSRSEAAKDTAALLRARRLFNRGQLSLTEMATVWSRYKASQRIVNSYAGL